MTLSQDTFDCTMLGMNTVTVTVDAGGAGGMSTCTSTVTVVDSAAPTMVCTPVTVSLDAMGSGSVTVGALDGGSSDACGPLALMATQTMFGCGDVGSVGVDLTGTDGSGNSAMCTWKLQH